MVDRFNHSQKGLKMPFSGMPSNQSSAPTTGMGTSSNGSRPSHGVNSGTVASKPQAIQWLNEYPEDGHGFKIQFCVCVCVFFP